MADAAQNVDEYLESMNEASRLEYSWSGSACGVATVISNAVARFVWLGDLQVLHVRERSIVNSLACHTLSNALRETGHELVAKRYGNVLLKWLSRQHAPDTATWMLESRDAVIVCSPHIERLLLEEQLQLTGCHGLAQRVVAAANKAEPRIDHTMLVLRVSDAPAH